VTSILEKAAKIEVADDHLKAWAVFRPGPAPAVTEAALYEWVRAHRISLNEFVRGRLSELLALLQAGQVPAEPFLLSEGRAPVEPLESCFVWAPEFAASDHGPQDEASVNFYERNRLVTVDAGTVVGRIDPGRPGDNGVDVFGRPILPTQTYGKFGIGENVELTEDGQGVRATLAGQVILSRRKIHVRGVCAINGDIDFSVGNVDSASDVLVYGAVHDLFIVRSRQNISIKGMVEAAWLSAQGDITIIGGVKGRGKGIIEAGGDLRAKFLNSVYATAGGELEIGSELIDSHVLCRGDLKIRHGSIIGGCQYAVGRVVAKSIGSPGGVKTVVGAGFDPQAVLRLFEIERDMKKKQDVVEKVKSNVAPLLKQLKRLTADQREKATELMFRAEALEAEIAKLREEQKAIALPTAVEEGGRDLVEITAINHIHPNTVLHLADRVVTIREELPGPIKIVLRKVQGVTEALLVNRSSGSVRTLRAGQVTPDEIIVPARPEFVQPGAKPAEAQPAAAGA